MLLPKPMWTWFTHILRCSNAKRTWAGKHFWGTVPLHFFLHQKVGIINGRTALQTGVRIVNDVAEGQSFKDAAKTHLFGALEEDINNFILQAKGQSGSSN